MVDCVQFRGKNRELLFRPVVKKGRIKKFFSGSFRLFAGREAIVENCPAKAAPVDRHKKVFFHWFASAFPVHAHSLHTNLAFG